MCLLVSAWVFGFGLPRFLCFFWEVWLLRTHTSGTVWTCRMFAKGVEMDVLWLLSSLLTLIGIVHNKMRCLCWCSYGGVKLRRWNTLLYLSELYRVCVHGCANVS